MSGDLTVTELLARMDAHLVEMDADLARRDAEWRRIQEDFREQHVQMRQTVQRLADTSRFLDEATVEASQQHATTMQALEAMIARLERSRDAGGDVCGSG